MRKKYFLRNAVDCEKSIFDYIQDSIFNYVILDNNYPLTWGDGSPVIYGSLEDAKAESQEGDVIITEWEFLVKFYMNDIEEILINTIKENGEFDGNCYVHWLGEDFYGVINLDGYTDILGAFVGTDNMLSFLVSDENDNKQGFVDILQFDNDVIYKIINNILKYKN